MRPVSNKPTTSRYRVLCHQWGYAEAFGIVNNALLAYRFYDKETENFVAENRQKTMTLPAEEFIRRLRSGAEFETMTRGDCRVRPNLRFAGCSGDDAL
jgi:hypothetical protein